MEAVIPLASLRQVVKEIVAAGGSKRAVSAALVRVDEAPALLHLLSVESFRSGWEVKNQRRLKRLVITVDLLTVVRSALLPFLAEAPTDKRARDELRRYAVRVRNCAGMAGGRFYKEANSVADRLRHYLNQARRGAAPPALVAIAEEIRGVIARFNKSDLMMLLMDERKEVDDEVADEDEDGDSLVGAQPPQQLRGRQAAAPTIRVTSLRAALEAALEAGGSPRVALISSLHLRHASALQELLRYEAIRNGWELLNGNRANSLVLADNTLHVISAGILPDLADNPTDEPRLQMLQSYAQELKVHAKSIGGSADTELSGVADRLLGHVCDAHLHPLVRNSWLVSNSESLIDKIATLRSQQLTLSEEDA